MPRSTKPKFRTRIIEQDGRLFRAYVVPLPNGNDLLVDKAVIDLHPEGAELAIADEAEQAAREVNG